MTTHLHPGAVVHKIKLHRGSVLQTNPTLSEQMSPVAVGGCVSCCCAVLPIEYYLNALCSVENWFWMQQCRYQIHYLLLCCGFEKDLNNC